MVPNAQLCVIRQHEKKFSSAVIEFMNRTLSSNLISESVKRLRMNIFIQVVDVTPFLGPWWILRRVLLSDWQKSLRCIQFGAFREKLEEHHPRGHTLLRGMCGRRPSHHLVCSRAR